MHPVRRGLTLLEMLIVLGLLIAMGALAMPVVISTLHERQFESAMDVTGRQLLLARAHAQATGRPVEVLYVRDVRHIIARPFITADEHAEVEPIVQAWAHRVLPDGLSVSDLPPNGPPLPASDFGQERGTGVLRIAVFLPDGSALAAQPRWLTDTDGRAARLEISPYTGYGRFTRLAPPDLRQPHEAENSNAETYTWEER